MNEDDSRRRRAPGLFIPFVLLAVAVLFIMLWLNLSVFSQRSGFQGAKAQLAEAIEKRAPQVTQAAEFKNRLEALAIELLELARTDPTAEAIVKKNGIERALPAQAAGGGEK